MNRDNLKNKLIKYNIEFTEESIDKLVEFNNQMLEYNSKHNLF